MILMGYDWVTIVLPFHRNHAGDTWTTPESVGAWRDLYKKYGADLKNTNGIFG